MRVDPEDGVAGVTAGPDAHEWTAEALRDVLAPLVGQSRDLVVAVDDGPAMSIWGSTVESFTRALVESGVFGEVTVCALGVDDGGRAVLRGSGGASPPDMVGSGRRLLLALTDAVDPAWRSGGAWTSLRELGAAHSVAVVSPLSWWTACRTGLDLHRLRLRASEPGAPNHFYEWEPQVDVPGLYDDLGDVVPVSFVELAPAGLREWATLAAAAGWANLGAALVPVGSDLAPGAVPDHSDDVTFSAAELVAAYRSTASKVVFDLAVHCAVAPLELPLLVRILELLHPEAGRPALSEFLGGPLVAIVPRGSDDRENRVVFRFVREGIREELLAHGRRVDTERVRKVVRHYLDERRPVVAGFEWSLDDEPVSVTSPIVASPHVAEAERAVLGAWSGVHLHRYSTPQEHPGVEPPSAVGNDEARAVIHADEHDRTRVREDTVDVDRNAGGLEVTAVEQEERRRTLASPVFGGVPPRNVNFTGRADLLQELERRLVRGGTAAVLPETLHGMGGVGKSHLAIEYAYRNRANFDLIWWVPAERSVKIVNSLVELGQRLGLEGGAESNVAVQQVLDALRSGNHAKVPTNWLLIFDNADSPDAVQEYLPTGGTGRILVTSRNSQWLSVARPLEVNVFQRSESVQLLRRRDPELSEEDAGRLAEALGDLPLAIAQAAAWRVETGMPADEYLELLAEKQLELLNVTTTLDYPESVAAMWDLSLNELKRKNPSALRLLQVCAFLSPEPINRTMFSYSRNITGVPPELSRVLRDRLRLNEAIRDINRFALVRVDHRTNSIELHRLVQAVLISQMNEGDRAVMRNAAHLILGENDPEAPEEPDNWPTYVDLSAHLAASNAYESDAESVRSLLHNQVQFLYRWGEHKRSAELSERMYKNWVERLGEDHPETLRMGRWYGFMLWVEGRYAEATPFNLELLDRHRRVYGEEHEATIVAVGQVASDKRAEGDFVGALELSKRNYDICVRYLGDEDPVTHGAAHNLGVNFRLMGDFASAATLDADTWDRRVQIYGQEHEVPLNTQVGLVLDKRELGHYREAAAEQEEIVRIYERRSEGRPLNPAWLRAVRHLAVMRSKAGDHEGAMRAAETAFEGLRRRYNLDHPDVLAAALARSVELRHLGRHETAAQLAQNTLTRYAKTLGADHPHTLSAAVNVAILRRLKGDFEGARDLNQATLAGFHTRLGDDHPSTLITGINLASDLHALGDVQGAHDADVEILRRVTAVFGADHPTALACQVNLAQDVRSLGRTDEADQLHLRAVAALRERLGQHHPAVSELSDPRARANCDIDPMPL
ncbi:FxSxx-COOH system tetratricopeptide repeat protein [Saccharothrix luteola]|uniref:FxSxx-COOH system tetratricopeptide repeat protein n=1 Tax=Saccharothrix luteola TaxID=2893018 RepID=UPI001E34EEBD|nr:FxSxx-COOH system tetratricopeptide repeat protein [Saccharothrix luteola]MCC8247681.1 FxSxx-COOH system tetratricopeptide repeat protein [Saccharothrix luteola]